MASPTERLQVVGLAEACLVIQSLELFERIFPGCKRRVLRGSSVVTTRNQKCLQDSKRGACSFVSPADALSMHRKVWAGVPDR